MLLNHHYKLIGILMWVCFFTVPFSMLTSIMFHAIAEYATTGFIVVGTFAATVAWAVAIAVGTRDIVKYMLGVDDGSN